MASVILVMKDNPANWIIWQTLMKDIPANRQVGNNRTHQITLFDGISLTIV